jgi:chloramphenicol 3-O phosphotransferase
VVSDVVPGRVVILNGTTSAGKTTLIDLFLARRHGTGECWLTTGCDDSLDRLPVPWHGVPKYQGPFRDDGFCLERIDATRVEVRLGPLWQRLLSAYRRTVAVWARTGFDVVVDEVAMDEFAIDDWRDALEGLGVLWVAVKCDLAVAEAREKARGDRFIGMVRGQHDLVHRWATYDLELDTTERQPDELVADLEQAIAVLFDS